MTDQGAFENDDLHAELALLRKNEGFVPRRLQPRSLVRTVLGGDDDSFERLRFRLVSAIHSLEGDESKLLLDVFGLSAETQHLTRLQQRRQVHGHRIGRGIETVAAREAPALQHLVTRLVSGNYPQSPVTLHVPEMHGGIIYETTTTLMVIENRCWRETREHYRFVATFDEMDYLTIGRSHDAAVKTLPGGAFMVNTRAVEGAGWADHFWHLNAERTETSPMKRGGVYDLKFSVSPGDADEAKQPVKLVSRAFHERSLLATIRVGFIGERPRDIWKFEGVSPFATPQSASNYNRVELEENGTAALIRRDVHGGLFNGLAWSWNDDN